jgi:RNA polymerase sigma-70 factor (ECF subfamily)
MDPDTERSLIELMRLYCDDVDGAFRLLYDRVAGRLFHYALCMVGDRPSAEDVVQRTFLKLHAARVAYVRGADPLPWLYTIAHRVALDELRRRHRARTVSGDAFLIQARAGLDGAPEQLARDREQIEALTERTLQALVKLSDEQREAFVLLKLHKRSVAEASLVTGASPSAVKVRAHRALTALQALVAEPDPAAGRSATPSGVPPARRRAR